MNNPEFLEIAILGLSGMLFALGGTHIKAWRRIVLPAALFGYLMGSGIGLLVALVVSVFLLIGLCFGYGEKVPYWEKGLIGLSWTLPRLLIGWTPWIVITPLVWVLLFWLSNQKTTEKFFRWKMVEFITGVLIGVTYLQ